MSGEVRLDAKIVIALLARDTAIAGALTQAQKRCQLLGWHRVG